MARPRGIPVALPPGDHKRRIGGHSKERSVVPARVKAADIKIPVIVGENKHIGLDQTALPLPKTTDQPLILRQLFVTGIEDGVPVHLLI
jgi:hypothetical protein